MYIRICLYGFGYAVCFEMLPIGYRRKQWGQKMLPFFMEIYSVSRKGNV